MSRLFFGAAAGAVAGILGVIVHAGPVNYEWCGPIMAVLLVVCGSWFSCETGTPKAGVVYACVCFAVTFVLFFYPPGNDVTALENSFNSRLWLYTVGLAALFPPAAAYFVRAVRRHGNSRN